MFPTYPAQGRGPILDVRSLAFGYSRRGGEFRNVLSNLNFSVHASEKVVVMGRSGCGKSTLVKLIVGQLQPTAGGVSFAGVSPRSIERGHIGYLAQDTALLPWRTVAQNIALPFDLMGCSQDLGRVKTLLDRVGLSGCENYWPGELSGGMRARVALARAFILSPPILVLDEPYASLDPFTAAEMLDVVRDWVDSTGSMLLMVSHSVDHAVEIADRILILSAPMVSSGVMISRPKSDETSSATERFRAAVLASVWKTKTTARL